MLKGRESGQCPLKLFHIIRKICSKAQEGVRPWVKKGERGRVKGLPREGLNKGWPAVVAGVARTVESVTYERPPHELAVNADLMCASRFKLEINATDRSGLRVREHPGLKDVVVCNGDLPVSRLGNAHLLSVLRMASQWLLDASGWRMRSSEDKGCVVTLGPFEAVSGLVKTRNELLREGRMGCIVFSNKHETRSVFVEAVDDARTKRVYRRQVGCVR